MEHRVSAVVFRNQVAPVLRGNASDIARRPMSQMKPDSSRATATTVVLAFLPRAASFRYRDE